jgi:hydrogenase nickel incorporation protein HypB
MCGLCGCAGVENHHAHAEHHAHPHDGHHAHGHDGHHAHAGHVHDDHDHHGSRGHEGREHARRVRMETAVLAKNDRIAGENRAFFQARSVLALNVMSSPGAGKTALLERTIRDLGAELPLAVIEGDQETENDAARIRATGCAAIQINTGAGCHLDAERVGTAAHALGPEGGIVFIENVGNLVCPALFDLGERARVVVLSVTEGEDKPIKYPHMFRAADVMVLSKTDLVPHLDFDLDLCIDNARRVNPRLRVLPLSVRTGEGLQPLYAWFRDELSELAKEAR